ncbi:MAG TPA: Gldg family protein [Anaerolineae bacterium]|nr:Gldg family protein [Anaerolineae bacterium]HQH38985.1 Gldg family protein [Anaerolineae bacterium]
MKQILTITRKELHGYFGSPMAMIFIGAFLVATLFSFFWVDTFFARGIADVRPLFRWMPVLMIFIAAALTMRQWSEEQRSGTMEILLTLPVSTTQLVIGKFLAVIVLIGIALALTLFIPITVALLGNLDWGPVFGGYLAAILLAGAYAAIGLFVSSRTDNQIVALLSTVLLCGAFYLVGSTGVTNFTGNRVGEILRAIGAGSRFESIQRGVIDLRDLLYYITLAGIFLVLNILSLKAKGWSTGEQTLPQRRGLAVTSALLILNLLVVNVWVYPLHRLRVDLTQYHEYTLSKATRDLLNGLTEPLLIRGYFSERTHPLLAPLVPTVRDMLQEYSVASGGKVQVEIIDPAKDPDKEAEANQVYGISPTPFQVAGRYESSIINSYFDILIQYGDQSTTLGFDDLIEIKSRNDGSIDVHLRNLEYDLTSNIKKTVYGFQSIDTVLAALSDPVSLTLYITPNTLPEAFAEVPATMEKVAQEIAAKSNGKLTYTVVDPTQANSPISPQQLYDTYGIQPFAASLFSSDVYYMHMVLQTGDKGNVIYPSGEMSEADIRSSVEAALKRMSSGFLKVVGIWSPSTEATTDMYGQTIQPLSSWNQVREALRQEYEVRDLDLSTGMIASDVDVVLVIAPQGFTDKELYAIDQYLMRGGTVIMAAGNTVMMVDPYTGNLAGRAITDGVAGLLEHYGITVQQGLVLDPQNEPFPIPRVHQVGNFQVQEYQALNYPYFVDIRADGMAKNNAIVSNLPAITLNWASPILVDPEKNTGRKVDVLLSSTSGAWFQSDATNILPDFDLYPESGFAQPTATQVYTLAVSVQGTFNSYFAGKPSPLETAQTEEGVTTPAMVPATISSSPESARLLVVGSAEFVDDIVFQISSSMSGDRYLNSLQFVQNAVAWATEDLELQEIQARGSANRVLAALDESEQSFWEIANYGVALLALLALGGFVSMRRRHEQPMELIPPAAVGHQPSEKAPGAEQNPVQEVEK